MSDPLFSIILPVYNRESLVQRAIQSVMDQSCSSWELLICDDASTDSTKSKISFFLHDPRITFVFNNKNMGPGAARNFLLNRARGKYICFLDSDDFFFPDALRDVEASFRENKKADILLTVFEDNENGKFDDQFQKKVRRHISPHRDQYGQLSPKDVSEMLADFPEWEGLFLLCPTFFRSKCFDKIRFPEDIMVGEDQAVFRALSSCGYRFHPVDLLTYSYNIHGQNLHLSSPVRSKEKPSLGMVISLRERSKIFRIMLDKMVVPDWVSIYIVEDGPVSTLGEKTIEKIDGYKWMPSSGPFNKGACFNHAVKTWYHPHYLFHDCDLVPEGDFFPKILEKFQRETFDMMLPWDQIIYLDEKNTSSFLDDKHFSGKSTDKPIGGSVLFERSFYLKIGGMNEDFRGWGLEDFEVIERANWLRKSKTLIRHHCTLYHLWHGYDPTAPSSSMLASPHYKNNCKTFSSIRALSEEGRYDLIKRLRKQFQKKEIEESIGIGDEIIVVYPKGLLKPDQIKDVGGNTNLRLLEVEHGNPLIQRLKLLSKKIKPKVETPEEILDEWALETDDSEVEIIESTVQSSKKIMIMADEEGWAFDRIAHKMKELLSREYEVTIVYAHQGPKAVSSAALSCSDVFIALGYQFLKKVCRNRKPLLEKTIFCGYDHLHFAKPRRSPETIFLNEDLDWLNSVAVMTVSSKILMGIYQRHFPGREIYLVQDGVDSDLFKPSDPNMSKTISVGWCGRTNRSDLKGVEIIREACEDARVRFVCLDADAGGKKMEDMPQFYKEIDVYACASLCEGTPNPILEASSCGLPWVSTGVGIVPELWGSSCGGVIVNRDKEEFAKAIAWLRNDPDSRRDFGERNRLLIIEQFSWENRLSRICDAVSSVLRGNK